MIFLSQGTLDSLQFVNDRAKTQTRHYTTTWNNLFESTLESYYTGTQKVVHSITKRLRCETWDFIAPAVSVPVNEFQQESSCCWDSRSYFSLVQTSCCTTNGIALSAGWAWYSRRGTLKVRSLGGYGRCRGGKLCCHIPRTALIPTHLFRRVYCKMHRLEATHAQRHGQTDDMECICNVSGVCVDVIFSAWVCFWAYCAFLKLVLFFYCIFYCVMLPSGVINDGDFDAKNRCISMKSRKWWISLLFVPLIFK